MAKPRYPEDHDPVIEVRPAIGRFDDFRTVLGLRSEQANGCWCMSYRDSRLGVAERVAHMKQECASDPGPGVLVYVDDEVAGWCSIAPRSDYGRLLRSRTIPILDDLDAWIAVCFVVRAGYRKRGLMHHLLEGAVAHAEAHGAAVVEGYPVQSGGERVDVISGYVGSVDLFESAGFTFAAPTTGHSGGRERVIMRKYLTNRGGRATTS
jgi:GNAT superfamily N-acetyltransferase